MLDGIRIRHSDPNPKPNKAFAESFTGTDWFANSLLGLVQNSNIGCTVALNGPWGSGKTTFLKMWKQFMIDKGFKAVYLNAWKTDWAEDPLIAILACVSDACADNSSNIETLDQAKKLARNFRKDPTSMLVPIVKAIVQSLANVDLSEIQEQADALSGKAFDSAISSFNAKEQSMAKFKESLEKLAWDVNQASEQKSLIFIIDELDRCKPDYAVRMLEVLKHLFSVPNIFFICGVDRKHIEDSIRGYYGSDQLDATEYLRRFFDIEVDLPVPDYKRFCQHLYEYYSYNTFYDTDDRYRHGCQHDENSTFVNFFYKLASKKELTLRQLERIFAFTRLSLTNKKAEESLHIELTVFLVFIKFFDKDFYDTIERHLMTPQQVCDRFAETYGSYIEDNISQYSSNYIRRNMVFMFSLLLVSYVNNTEYDGTRVYDTSKNEALVTCSCFEKNEFEDALKYSTTVFGNYRLAAIFRMLKLYNINR